MLLSLAIITLSTALRYGGVLKTANVYFVCKLSKTSFALLVVCSKLGEVRSSIAVTDDRVSQKWHLSLRKRQLAAITDCEDS